MLPVRAVHVLSLFPELFACDQSKGCKKWTDIVVSTILFDGYDQIIVLNVARNK